MTNKKRRIRRKYFIRRCIFVLVILLILYLIYNIIFNIFIKDDNKQEQIIPNNKESNNTSYKIDFNITYESEEDTDIIDTVFMDGMNLNDFESILKLSPKKVNSSSKYNYVDYNFDNKLHYYELENYYKELNNSDIVSLYEIGKSVDNRIIYGIEIGKGTDVLFLDANIHAAEVSTTYILLKYLIDVVNEYESNDNNIRELLEHVKIAAIPCINPDGYDVYNFGIESLNNKDLWIYQNKDKINFEYIKSNANGVDLNRNFPTQNSGLVFKDKKMHSNTSTRRTTNSNKYYNGDTVGSEPEIKAAMYFMLKHHKNIYAYLNIHSQGRVLYAGKPNLSDNFNDITQKFAKWMSKINGYRVHGVEDEYVGVGNDGSATDFMAELANGFIFSSKTGRLSTDKYIDNNCEFKYSYPVITMEVSNTWNSRYFNML